LRDVKQAYKKLEDLNKDLDNRVADRTYEVEKAINQLLSTNKKLQNEIKERLETEQQLKRTEDILSKALIAEKELNELKSRFVTTASHEFRTPLSTVLSSASLVLKYPQAEDQENRAKHISKIKVAVNHLTGLLNDFLSLSKLEESKVNVTFEEVNILEILDLVNEELSGILKENQKIIYDHGISLIIETVIFKNILFNIISNAIKYSSDDIIIKILEDQNVCNVEIRDTGIGVPLEDQKHLFSRFFRATNVGSIQGTGLGLNIVRKYCELIKGDISLTSQYGVGTSVKILLPKSLNTDD
jgi:two-component system, LuxR family, sensor kinase FixL